MLIVEREGAVAVWTIHRPESRNALDHATLRALAEAVGEANSEATLRAVVLTGSGTTFASGGDLRELRDRNTRADAEHFSDLGWDLTRTMGEAAFPIIAALPGPAIGGGAELALACDLRVADPCATFAFRHVRMGVTTAWGSVPRLTSLVGAGTAARLLFTGQEVGASEAKTLGLVDAVTSTGCARMTALAWAADIAFGSPEAVASMKCLLRASTAGAAASDVRGLERERFVDTWSSAAHKSAVEAHFAKRATHR